MSTFYILDVENFATASRRCTGVINVDGQLVGYTVETVLSITVSTVTPSTVERVVAECTSLLYVGRWVWCSIY